MDIEYGLILNNRIDMLMHASVRKLEIMHVVAQQRN